MRSVSADWHNFNKSGKVDLRSTFVWHKFCNLPSDEMRKEIEVFRKKANLEEQKVVLHDKADGQQICKYGHKTSTWIKF